MVSLVTSHTGCPHPTTGIAKSGTQHPAQGVAGRALESPRSTGKSLQNRAKPLTDDQKAALKTAVTGQENRGKERGELFAFILFVVLCGLACTCFWLSHCKASDPNFKNRREFV